LDQGIDRYLRAVQVLIRVTGPSGSAFDTIAELDFGMLGYLIAIAARGGPLATFWSTGPKRTAKENAVTV